MSTYLVGQLILLSDVISRTATGAIVSDPTDAVTVYKPDGSTATPAVVHPGVDDPNAYEAQLTLDQGGWWEYVFSSTGTAAGRGRGRFYVSPVP